MVDFGELRNKAEGLIAEHSEQVKDGIEKVGDFVGNKIGHNKVDGVEDKLQGFVDNIAHRSEGEPPVVPAPVVVTEPVDETVKPPATGTVQP